MNATQKVLLFLILSAGWLVGLYFALYQRPDAERTAVARIRKAKTISIEAKGQRGSSGLEAVTTDIEGLARTLRIVSKGRPEKAPRFSVPVYDLDEVPNQLIVWLFPPDIGNFDGTFYKIDPAFWAALLDRAPKTREWVDKRLPGAVPPAGTKKPLPGPGKAL
jgi:hypothetical protein